MTVTIEPAAALAAPLEALKTYLAISLDDEDDALTGLIRAASEVAERYLGQLLIARAVTQTLGVRSGWQRLAIRPVTGITAVDGLPADGAAFPLPVESYAVDIDAGGTGHIRISTPGAAGRVRVRYTAGLANDADAVPDAIRHGIIRLAGEYHARREGLEPDPPASVTALWRPWRRVQLA
ncbi:MAG TPA: phage head-tail connector protein [Sphingobium sp.]|nr:phage head-tail connector protein [Sphingobium sp.]